MNVKFKLLFGLGLFLGKSYGGLTKILTGFFYDLTVYDEHRKLSITEHNY